MEMDRDFSEFIASFNAHDVRYLIVGGYALAAHGLPRATGDLDAWVRVDEGNAERIMTALLDFGFEGLGLTAEDFRAPDRVVQLGWRTRAESRRRVHPVPLGPCVVMPR